LTNRVDDARMRPATADISLQELSDFGGCWIGLRMQERDTAHDHSWCTEGALESTRVEKSLLDGMQEAFFFQPFDGRN
jgi:hypothetical protein